MRCPHPYPKQKNFQNIIVTDIDAHRGGGRGGIKVYPSSKIFAKLVKKRQ
jgi:hypothetical protein